MDITVTCPEVRCGRCGDAAPVLPAVLRSLASTVPVFVGSKLASPVAGFSAAEAGGVAWQVVAAAEPDGWGSSPDGGRLCPRCLAAWNETAMAFANGTLSDRALQHLPMTRDLPPPETAPAIPEALPKNVQKTAAPVGPPPRVDHHHSPMARAEVRASATVPQRVTVAATPAQVSPRPGAVVSALPQVALPSRVSPVPNVVRREEPAPVPVVVRGPARVAPLPTPSATQRALPTEQVTPAPATSAISPVPAPAQRAPVAQLAPTASRAPGVRD